MLDPRNAQQAAIYHGNLDPIAFVASNDLDVMYYDQSMKQPDSAQFSKAWDNEIAAHHDNGIGRLSRGLISLAKGTKVVPSVWSMKRKCRIYTRGEAYKWKACLNIRGGKQE